jgi:hypothetical protein
MNEGGGAAVKEEVSIPNKHRAARNLTPYLYSAWDAPSRKREDRLKFRCFCLNERHIAAEAAMPVVLQFVLGVSAIAIGRILAGGFRGGGMGWTQFVSSGGLRAIAIFYCRPSLGLGLLFGRIFEK